MVGLKDWFGRKDKEKVEKEEEKIDLREISPEERERRIAEGEELAIYLRTELRYKLRKIRKELKDRGYTDYEIRKILANLYEAGIPMNGRIGTIVRGPFIQIERDETKQCMFCEDPEGELICIDCLKDPLKREIWGILCYLSYINVGNSVELRRFVMKEYPRLLEKTKNPSKSFKMLMHSISLSNYLC